MTLPKLSRRGAAKTFARLAAAFLAAASMTSGVAAEQPYASVQGWSILAIDYGQGFGCTMQRERGGRHMLLHLKDGQWELGLRSRRAPGDPTTIDMDVDRASEVWQAQVYPGGFAIANVTDAWVSAIAQAGFIQAATDGRPMREISARGTAAAIAKVRDCAAFHGLRVPGAGQTAAVPQGQAPVVQPAATGFQLYANVRGWEVFTNTPGCMAMRPSDVIVSFNTPPAGGWELQIEDFEGLASDTSIPAQILVDGQVFTDTFYAGEGLIYGSFEVDLRKAMAAGQQATIIWGHNNLVLDLNGVTAALLKVEECWHRLTGYDASTSSRAGTYAFQ